MQKTLSRTVIIVLLFTMLGTLMTGCIRSRMRISSSPALADVYINDVHYGRTPVEIPFTWYWHYKVELRKEGYEPSVQLERLRAPVYFWIPFDLVFELLPFPVYDTKKFHYNLYKAGGPS